MTANIKDENKNTPKKLTTSSINRLSKKFNEKKKVFLTVEGETFECLIDEHFRKTSMQKVVTNYIKFIYDLRSLDEIDDDAVLDSTILLDVLVLQEFTNLPIPSLDDSKKLVRVARNLVDLGIVEQLLGDGDNAFSKENIELVKAQANKAMENLGKNLSELVLMSELDKADQDKIDVDDYFSELDLRNFEIAEDEDITLLPRVINQLTSDGIYDEYMSKFTKDELDKLDERLNLFEQLEDGGINEGI